MTDRHIVVDGLDEFRRNLRKIDNQLGKGLGQRVNKEVGKVVVDLADRRRRRMQHRFPSYSPRVTKIRPSANQRRVIVTVRPPAAEFGSDTHVVFGRPMDAGDMRRRVWPRWSGNQFTKGPGGEVGYLVFPTLREDEAVIADVYVEHITRFARSLIGG